MYSKIEVRLVAQQYMTTVYSIKYTLSIEIIDKQRTEFIVIWLVRRRVSPLNGLQCCRATRKIYLFNRIEFACCDDLFFFLNPKNFD